MAAFSNGWVLAREITVAGFAADPNWRTTPDPQLKDAGGAPTRAVQIPLIGGAPSKGFAVMMVGLTANNAPVAPGAGTITFDVLEVMHSNREDFDGQQTHIAAVEDFTTALTALSMALPANIAARLPNVGGAQNLFAFRVSALSAPAGATKVQILVKPL